jgi:hypothetical protein
VDSGIDLFNVNSHGMMVPIQIKTATSQTRSDHKASTSFTWTIEKKRKTRRDTNQFYVFVAMCDMNRFFVVPTTKLIDCMQIRIHKKVRPNSQPHWIESYEDCWDLLA